MSDDNHDESSDDNHEESCDDEAFTDINFDSSTEVAHTEDAPTKDAVTTMVDNYSIIYDPESIITLKSKQANVAAAAHSPVSTSTIALLFSATTNTIATLVEINVLPARSHANVDAVCTTCKITYHCLGIRYNHKEEAMIDSE